MSGGTLRRRWLRLAVLLGCSAAAATGCATRNARAPAESDESQADKHYDVAVGSFHNGMFEDAKLQLDKALTADPEHADSYYLRGVLLLNEGQTIINSIEFDQCLTDDAAEQQRRRAESLHAEAGKAFDKAATLFPENAAGRGRAYNSMSVVSLFFHHDRDAIEQARLALKEQFYTDRYSALANLGWAFYRSGDLVSATAELRQAVLINPDFCVGHYRLAQVYLETGLVEQALEHAQAVMKNERCPIQDVYRIAGVAQLRLGQTTQAVQSWQQCIEVAPRSCLAKECRTLVGPEGASGAALAHVEDGSHP